MREVRGALPPQGRLQKGGEMKRGCREEEGPGGSAETRGKY